MENHLTRLPALALDCQTTGAVPEKGRLLEMGWAYYPDTGTPAVSFLARLPKNETIPPRVRQITGIMDADLARAFPPEAVWKSFVSNAQRRSHDGRPPVVVIHYARFEGPFLADLARRCGFDPDFHVICTHEITRRLLPFLPCKGLRAVAGHFGFHLAQARRAGPHALATCFIWKNLARILDREKGIATLADLDDWLKTPFHPPKTGRKFSVPKKLRLALPQAPGVYTFLGPDQAPLYVGTAKNLKRRVNSHFKTKGKLAQNMGDALSRAKALDAGPAVTALEAALLESHEILRLSPACNIALRPCLVPPVFITGRLETTGHGGPGAWGPFFFDKPPPWLCLLRAFAAGGPFPDAAEDRTWAGDIHEKDWKKGVDLFNQRWEGISPCKNKGRHLLKIGKKVWENRRDAGENPAPNDPEDPEDLEDPPGRVARQLEKAARQFWIEVKKAGWRVLLSRSSLAWETPRLSPDKRRLLIFSRARILAADRIPAGSPVPPPSFFGRSPARRRASLDRAAWQHMGVLTAQLRRLLSQNRQVTLKTGAGRGFDAEALRRVLAVV